MMISVYVPKFWSLNLCEQLETGSSQLWKTPCFNRGTWSWIRILEQGWTHWYCRHFHLSQSQWRHDAELRIALSHAFNTPSQCVFCIVEHLQALRSLGTPVRDSRGVSKRYRITDFTTPVRWCSEHSTEIINFNVSCLYTWNCLLLSSLSRAAPAEQWCRPTNNLALSNQRFVK